MKIRVWILALACAAAAWQGCTDAKAPTSGGSDSSLPAKNSGAARRDAKNQATSDKDTSPTPEIPETAQRDIKAPVAGKGSGAASVATLTAGTFEAQTASGLVLVDFWAPWCPPCRQQGPIVDRLADQVKGAAKIAKLNVDDAKEVAQRFNISGIPTLILFKGGKEVKRFVGLTEAKDLVAAIESNK
jgi:thioredoxin 1